MLDLDQANLWLIAGPTAVGKSEVALLLAERINGEIISADSMQVYRGMDIGTAKPSAAERARIPHHVVDLVCLQEPFDASAFIQAAHAAVDEISARGRTPIICGGTGFYLKALIDGLGNGPASDLGLRAILEQTPVELLLEELKATDPAAYDQIDRRNPRRVIRAVEIFRLTGRPVGEARTLWNKPQLPPPPRHVGLSRVANDLKARIDARVDCMFAQGLVQEVESLLPQGLAENRNAMQALGYRQVIDFLNGERTLEDTVELVKSRTRKFAKRQMTWFRGQLSLRWLDLQPDETPERTVERILATGAYSAPPVRPG